jgi:2,3-bisphosphoglycerate-independent phosphoglycerate mutase
VRPVCLVVLDGFGIGSGGDDDATALAETPFFDRLDAVYPHTSIETSGRAVGLPPGQMGNSEVGHMTLGSGRVIDHDLIRIQRAFESAEAASHDALADALDAAAEIGSMHLLGLVSGGGVHSALSHLDGLLDLLAERGITPILHAMTDGRDTPPQSALEWIRPLEERCRAMGGSIASVCGRYYAMDRDTRWERIALAYDALVFGRGIEVASAVEAVEKAYARDEGDEFIRPSVVTSAPTLGDGDVALFWNFRADRARELTNALTRVRPELLGAEITERRAPALGRFVTFTLYDETFGLPVVFGPASVREGLGELIARAGKNQLRIAETEKYAHVTYFFNGGVEEPWPGEERILIPSPKDVPTYDLKPEMSAIQVTDALLAALEGEPLDFVLVNYANPDMVGHTGKVPAGVRAVETVDACLDRLAQSVLAKGGCLLITADHGNIEQLVDPKTGGPHTAHTTNPVPLWWVLPDPEGGHLEPGGLADLAPSLCSLLDLEPSPEMTGRSLLSCEPPSSSS